MRSGLASSFICETKQSFCDQRFVFLKELINHPLLNMEEKFFGIWLATRSANNLTFSCSYNYEQIAKSLNKPTRDVHRGLFRLLLMGFLRAEIPVWYGEPTAEMTANIMHFKLVLPFA